MLMAEIIRKNRDGGTLSEAELVFVAQGITSESASEGQIAAFAMAVFFRGMTRDEAAAFTGALRDSGEVLDWSDLPGPVTDKHSTGGVGDNVSLMLAPIVAACGAFVPMISGRGLGHTGGTLDKMDAIPGYASQPDTALFRRTVERVGCAIIGQTASLAPADKRLYGIRDVTATVESVPLITASILSKKLAAGLQSLVLDVKCGNGAFMDDPGKARELAESLTGVAQAAGLPCRALVTDMNQPLARAAGNAVEVASAVAFLTGEDRDTRLEAVTLALAGEMLRLSGLAETEAAGAALAKTGLETGRAAEVFGRMVAELGGPADFVARYRDHLPAAPVVRPVTAPSAGRVAAIATREVGLAVVELGGGRRKASDTVDPRVGFTELLPLGAEAGPGQPLAMVHAADVDSADRAAALLTDAYTLADTPPPPAPVILERIG
jgi:thymidine phosphorylase